MISVWREKNSAAERIAETTPAARKKLTAGARARPHLQGLNGTSK
jgi:hypothetical protein